MREAHSDGDSAVVDAKRKLKDSRNDKHPEKAEGIGLLEGLCAEKARPSRLPSLVRQFLSGYRLTRLLYSLENRQCPFGISQLVLDDVGR